MYKYIVILLSIVLVGCARNNETETPKYSNRTVFFGSAYIEGFGGVCMMADTLTGDGFEVLVPDYLAELIPDVQSTVDMGKTYTDENYEFYTIYGLKGGEYYPTLNIVLDGGARFQAKVKVVNFTDQGWVLESCAPNLQSGWPNIIIGTGAAKNTCATRHSIPTVGRAGRTYPSPPKTA